MTFDQLALRAPTGSNCLLLRGPLKAREVYKFFGKAPGEPPPRKRLQGYLAHKPCSLQFSSYTRPHNLNTKHSTLNTQSTLN